jgi:hypothetical protein
MNDAELAMGRASTNEAPQFLARRENARIAAHQDGRRRSRMTACLRLSLQSTGPAAAGARSAFPG